MLAAGAVQAQMAHEVLLLVNKNSQPSMRVANTFAELRQIPKINMVYLDIPVQASGGSATVTPEEFTRLIWEPANAAARKRGIDERILAWVYSVDFPIRVKTDANDRRQMSVGGLTFMRNEIPGLSLVEEGKYLSKLFGGPNSRLKVNLVPLSLGLHKRGLGMNAQVQPEAAYRQFGLGERMPLPSMMLGYTGENGSSVETVLESIRRGRASDYRGLRSGIYFVSNDDVRSKCREWQFYPAVNELKQRTVEAVVTTNFPAGAENVMGLMMGAEKVDPGAVGSFAPGAMAEHLTSWSAEFQKPQTKTTRWIDAGATATAGSVVEPYSNPDKFPSARFFSHYAAGCTILESFYQSIACPLQILLLGEPLARPYGVPLSVKVLGANRLERDFTYMAQAQSRVPNVQFLYSFLLDGKEIRGLSDDPTVYVRALKMSDGYHELRTIVRIKHTVEFNASAVKPFYVDRAGRSVSLRPAVEKTGAYTHAVQVDIGGTEMPEKLQLVSGIRVLDEVPYSPEAQLTLDEQQIGEGPNRIRAVGIYPDGMEVSSAPLSFEIKFAKDS
jgi:uncharacterized protein (TIGR03790 family)